MEKEITNILLNFKYGHITSERAIIQIKQITDNYKAMQLHKTQVIGSDILETINESMQLIDYMHQLTVIPDNLMEDYANRFANTMSLLATLRNHYR